MTSIAVIGPGAVGCVAAASLALDSANEVTLCARSPLADIEVQTPDGPIRAAPRVLTSPEEAGPTDWVLVCTKAYDAASTARWLERLVGPDTQVAILQNGVEHRERFAGLVPDAQLLPAVVDIPANRTSPGRVIQHRFGSIIVPEGAPGDRFCALFAQSRVDVSTTPDFASRAWQKLCLNSVGAVTALTLAPTGPAWNPRLAAVVRALVEECAAVARAEGATVPQELIESVVAGASRSKPSGGRNSMEADRLAGRPMEIDARNGAIVRFGRKHAVPTPMNELFVTLLEASDSPWATGDG